MLEDTVRWFSNESQLREYIDQLQDDELRLFCQNKKLSNDFLRELEDRLNWDVIFLNQKFDDKSLDEFHAKKGLWSYFLTNGLDEDQWERYEDYL